MTCPGAEHHFPAPQLTGVTDTLPRSFYSERRTMMNLEKITMPWGLLEVEKPKVAEALRAHYDAGKPVQVWVNNFWERKDAGHPLFSEYVYRAAPGSTDRKFKKPKVKPLVVTDWGLVGNDVVAVSRDEDGWINLHGYKDIAPYYSHGEWHEEVITCVPPDTFPFIDPGTCKPEDSLVWRPGFEP